MLRRTSPLALLALILFGALLPPLPRAEAADVPRALVEAYEAAAVGRDAAAYAAQRDATAAIADLRSEHARAALRALLVRYGDADYQRASILLGAWVRYGTTDDFDDAVQWVEQRKDPLLLDLLHTVAAEVQLPSTRLHLVGPALRGAAPRVKAQLIRALGMLGGDDVVPPLLAMVREENLLVRVEALEALGRLRTAKALPVVQVFLRDANTHLREAAARALGMLGNPRALPALERALGDAAPGVVESAARALGAIGDPRAVVALIDGLARVQGKDLRVEDAYVEALQAISGKGIHADAELWRAWWLTVKDKTPFTKAEEKPGRKTVTGPRYYGFPVRSSRLVFVLDVSRSMGWNGRLDSAKQELIQVLEHLPSATRFNIIVFSDRVYPWAAGLTEAKPARVRRAIAFVRRQRALQGTNTYGALVRAFQEAEADTVFFLSDGHPSVGRVVDPQVILTQVREWNRFRRVRVHGVALLRGAPPAAFQSLEDPARSLWFMQRLTKQNDGRFKELR